jgi:very-short-patch-repair endonuclease
MKHYPHYIIDLARRFRKQATSAEEILWTKLRNQRLAGLKFRRQRHIGRYISDFYCAELKLVIELEGKIHEKTEQREYDENRFEQLNALGLRILRIENEEVLNNIEMVIEKILTLSPG